MIITLIALFLIMLAFAGIDVVCEHPIACAIIAILILAA